MTIPEPPRQWQNADSVRSAYREWRRDLFRLDSRGNPAPKRSSRGHNIKPTI
jgi:hypothetical protein